MSLPRRLQPGSSTSCGRFFHQFRWQAPIKITLELRPSRLLLLGGGVGHLLAFVAVIVSSIPGWVKAGLIAGIALSLSELAYRYGYPCGNGFIARVALLDESWQLETGDGHRYRGQLTSGYAHPFIVILNFRLENGKRRSLTLLPDCADADGLRRIRVWLRTQSDKDASDPS